MVTDTEAKTKELAIKARKICTELQRVLDFNCGDTYITIIAELECLKRIL